MATSTRSARGRSGPARRSVTDDAPLGRPLFLLNLKAYPSCLGSAAETIGRSLASLSRRRGVAAALAPAMPDLGRLAGVLDLPVLAQHVDPVPAGAQTGFVPAEAVRAAGAAGSLVNHSEHPLRPRMVEEVVARLVEVRLAPVVCAGTVREARVLARLRPPYLAIEPPELIGGQVSVASARPEVVSATVRAVRRISPRTHVLCGAGIHDRRDVARALELGSEGILVASAVARAKDPRGAIQELLLGFPPDASRGVPPNPK